MSNVKHLLQAASRGFADLPALRQAIRLLEKQAWFSERDCGSDAISLDYPHVIAAVLDRRDDREPSP
jgi:hypothetical protein